jgi:hypothetical protein
MKIKKGCALALCIILSISMLASVPGSAWTGSVSLSPYNVYQGEPTEFTLTVYNTGSSSMDVYWVWVHFCWQSSSYGYYFKADDGSTVTIPGDSSHDFTKMVTVSESRLGSCEEEVRVRAQAVGDWWAETKYFTEFINIKEIPVLQVSATGNPNTGTAPLTVYFDTFESGGLSPCTYSWAFGDGSTSDEKDPVHTYAAPGTYTAKVTVTDGAHNSQTVSDSITVTVTGTGTGGGGGGLIGGMDALTLLLILSIIIIVVVVAVAVILGLRKRPPEPSQFPPPPQAP